jgi:hypothetical protein
MEKLTNKLMPARPDHEGEPAGLASASWAGGYNLYWVVLFAPIAQKILPQACGESGDYNARPPSLR